MAREAVSAASDTYWAKVAMATASIALFVLAEYLAWWDVAGRDPWCHGEDCGTWELSTSTVVFFVVAVAVLAVATGLLARLGGRRMPLTSGFLAGLGGLVAAFTLGVAIAAASGHVGVMMTVWASATASIAVPVRAHRGLRILVLLALAMAVLLFPNPEAASLVIAPSLWAIAITWRCHLRVTAS